VADNSTKFTTGIVLEAEKCQQESASKTAINAQRWAWFIVHSK